jgi:hypothetical protein
MSEMRLFAATAVVITVLSACSREPSRRMQSTDTAIVTSPKRAASKGSGSHDVALRGEPLPPGVKLESGATIPNTDYVIRRVATPRGGAIWLDSVSQDRVPIRRAELTLPPLATDERVMLASCDVNGRLDPFVVAIVVSETNVRRLTKVRQAWRANSEARRFDLLPLAGIVCEDPGS